jgi:peptidylprolyl isomerase domain and WD repeat-containing protein 1
MINILKFDYTPKAVCWVHQSGAGQTLLAVSDEHSPKIRIYDGRGDGQPLHTLERIHRAPVHVMTVRVSLRDLIRGGLIVQYSSKYDCVVSADEQGFVEYWQPSEPWGVPSVPGMWSFKSSTDLFHFKKVSLEP